MSEIRVDTISEKTSANGVTIDGLTIKDGKIQNLMNTTLNASDLGAGLHIKTGDSGGSANANADELILEGTGSGSGVGMGILAATNGFGYIVFGDSGGNAQGGIQYHNNGDSMRIYTNDSERVRIDSSGNFGVNNTSPARQVHITNTIANSGASLGLTSSDSSTSGSFGIIHFGNNTDSSLASIGGFADGATDAGALVFKTEATGGAIEERVRFSSSEAVFNEGSFDIDFRVESNGQANMLFVDGGNNRVHINGTTGTREFNVSGDNTRLLLYSTNNSTGAGQLQFGDADDEQIGRIMYEHDGNKMTFHTAATERMRIHGGGEISTGGETAPDVTPGAICLNQAASDQAILTFKSSDVAHGMTVVAETDTFVSMLKNSDGGGALNLTTLSETATAFRHVACATGSNTAESLAATSVWGVDTRLKDGSSVTGPGADDNIASFRTSDQAQVIFKGDGEIFSNQSATVGTYDAYEDAQLIRAYDLSHMKGVIDSKFDKFVQYNKDDLQKARLIGTDDDGNATSFVNWTGMSRLHNGAIWQQYEKHQKLASAFYKLAEKTIGKEEADKLLTEEEIQLLN